jgi:hypothetical protein
MAIDFARLREQTIGSNVDEEAVTVNTRALIDKVLARYSGDWTTLRELIQNAADASATKVVIRLETLPSKTVALPQNADKPALLSHVVSHHTLYRLVVSNNGHSFADSDWARLKRIAEGNPDETKIGAFGVGFYSVFADCEEPFVISGDKTMAFVWKGNSLFTKASMLAADQASQDTCFVLNYRNTTSPIPDLMSICQFLCTSLTFVGLESIEFWLDSYNILQLHKKSSPATDANLPPDINTKTKEGLMKIIGVTEQSSQMDAVWMNVIGRDPAKGQAGASKDEEEVAVPVLKSFFTRIVAHASQNSAAKRAAREAEAEAQRLINENVHATSRGTVFLRISTVSIQTHVSSSFATELERATKKPPPKKTQIAILTSSHDETSASLSSVSGITSDKAETLFSSVMPHKHGRIFIGFPTSQTTGMLCHISAPSVIPTVERESIDLNARYVKTWNMEMLRVAGIACRIAYSGSMGELKRSLDSILKANGRVSPTPVDIDAVLQQASHIFRQYTGKETTPAYSVGKLIEEAFWECSKKATITILSSKGILPSYQVRLVSEPLSFLGNIPIIPSSLAKGAEEFVRRLYERGLISDMTITDVSKELEAQSLKETQVVEFLKWLGEQATSGSLDINTIQTLLNAAVGAVEEPNDAKTGVQRLIALSQVKTFLSGSKIPPIMPVPESTIPFKLTKNLSVKELAAFGWEELQIVPWIRYLIDGSRSELPTQKDVTQSPEFAASVIHVISKQWDHISSSSRTTIIELFSTRKIMPTIFGLKLPSESYFASVKLFDDLPRLTPAMGTVKDKVLVALGVRKTIELNVVFERLMGDSKGGGPTLGAKWSFVDLIRYLVSVKDDIPAQDIARLRVAAICPVETTTSGNSEIDNPPVAFHQVYEPKEVLRKLGLPLLSWPERYNTISSEARFMRFLGLKVHPVGLDVLTIMVQAGKSGNLQLYTTALAYFIENYDSNGYDSLPKATIGSMPFLPIESKSFPALTSPSGCYANDRSAVLGYPVLKQSLKHHAYKFGVKLNPDIKDCVACIIGNPPTSRQDAVEAYGYFSGRLGEITHELADKLGAANIVPVASRTDKGVTRMCSPVMCFLGDPTTYGEILDFVDFGLPANTFLLKLGCKHEPSSLQIASLCKDSPATILKTLGEERYLDLLRQLAEKQQMLKSDKKLWSELKLAPFLLSYRECSSEKSKIGTDQKTYDPDDFENDDNIVRVCSLCSAATVVIIDTIREYTMFREFIHAAPQDDALETFYQALGTPLLTSIVSLDQRVGNARRDQSEAQSLQQLVTERSRLFLHEYSPDVLLHDSKWLEKNLNVQVVDAVALSYTLKGYNVAPFRERKTATLKSERNRTYTLNITHQPDPYEISSWIVRLLLKRPKQRDTLALEMVLSSDLRRLRTKGYNVDRILRQKAYETRMAEEGRRKQQLEEERQAEDRRLTENERAIGNNGVLPPSYEAAAAADSSPINPHTMPGGFEPDSPTQPQSMKKKGKNLMSNISEWSKQLGFGENQTGSGSTSVNHVQEPAPPEDLPGNERNISRNLDQAIQACRPHVTGSVFSPPASTTIEQAKGSYCDTTPAQNLVFATNTSAGIKLFLGKQFISERDAVLSLHSPGLIRFSSLLLELGAIFSLPAHHIHIYYDPASSAIAFNLSGSLFFSLHFFEQLHLVGFETSPQKKTEAIAYWWITICHELAHNLVQEHSAAHSFYTESFAQQYFAKVMEKALRY